MDEKIINYLIVKQLNDPRCEGNPHIKVRTAYILARKELAQMTQDQKEQIIKKIKDEK